MGIAVGIDLGTTNSCIAVVEDNRATVIPDLAGRRIQPSVVSFLEGEQVVAGHEGRERLILDSQNTVYSFKRLLGRDFSQPAMRKLLAELPYKVRVGADNIPSVAVRDREISLPEISALMLRHLRDLVHQTTGIMINEAVITVPANFNDVQRSSTKVAGRIAGFNVLRILNEPTAAALAYGFGGNKTERIAVYDFGGGTFDITIVELTGDIYEVLSTAGDTFLGGDDFDKWVVEDMLSAFRAQTKGDLKGDMVSMQRMRSVAEKVKCQLSSLDEVQATLRELGGGPKGSIDFNYKLTRAKLEGLIEPLVERSMRVCDEALRLAGVDRSSLDNVVLVGGTTRIPMVRSRVAAYFGMAPRTEINPDEVVAIGAAIQAFSLTGEQLPPRAASPGKPPVAIPQAAVPGPAVKAKDSATWSILPPVLEAFGAEEDNLPAVANQGKPRRDETLSMGFGAKPKEAATFDLLDLTDDAIDDDVDLPAPAGIDLPGLPFSGTDLPAPAKWQDLPQAARERADLPAPVLAGLPAPVAVGLPALSGGQLPRLGQQRNMREPDLFSMPIASPAGHTGHASDFGRLDLYSDREPAPQPAPARAVVFATPVIALRDEVHGAATRTQEEPSFSVAMTARAPSALLLDVTPRAIGVGTAGGFCDICIERNAAIPVEQSRLFTTSTDLQTEVAINIFQGESRRVEENTKLGEVQLTGIRPAQRGAIKIRVTFEINTDGILGVAARNEETGEAQSTRIVLSGGIDEEQVERLVRKYAGTK